MSNSSFSSRRRFLTQAGLAGISMTSAGLSGVLRAHTAPAIITPDTLRPVATQGLQIGDVVADRASRMILQYAYHEDFRDAVQIRGPHAIETTDYTARVDPVGLASNRDLFVRAQFQNLDSEKALSEPVLGHFRTAPGHRSRDVRFVWGEETAGQGWGINPDIGGMGIYESMRRVEPDFFIHSGDSIYADGPILSKVTLPDGGIRRNIVTPEKSKVAEPLDEYRGNYRYNLLDENLRRFNAEVPQIRQWMIMKSLTTGRIRRICPVIHATR